ncbi:MAG: methyltransferase domain-containing protein [Candidatus Levybacteria bacterium]|nr:methyltransferase domain-containing protein [Candidatus Levybacteria bacterium]
MSIEALDIHRFSLRDIMNGQVPKEDLEQFEQSLTPQDDTILPVRMGSPYRLADKHLFNWGIADAVPSGLSEALYLAEWAKGEKVSLVSKVSELSGVAEFPSLLHHATAMVVAEIARERAGEAEFRILDIGGGTGDSAVAIFQSLPEEIRGKTHITILDPAGDSLKVAADTMERAGAANVSYMQGFDLEIGQKFPDNYFDVVTSVAAIHHHSNLEPAFRVIAGTLKPGGYFVTADYHDRLTEHPNIAYQLLLSDYNYPGKEEALEHFAQTYPLVKDDVLDRLSEEDRKAVKQMTDIWMLGWRQVYAELSDRSDGLYWGEAHRDAQEYIDTMRVVGLATNSDGVQRMTHNGIVKNNPHQILPDSSLLMVTVGQKLY